MQDMKSNFLGGLVYGIALEFIYIHENGENKFLSFFIQAYEPGRCQNVLKWKPPDMNSIDFKLQVVKECGEG